MQKIHLTQKNLDDFIQDNKYKIPTNIQFLSRCIDGRYQNTSDLPGLAIPGADAGELMLIFAAGHSYGFDVYREKTFKTLVEVIGGEKNLGFHSDSHAHGKGVLGGCGHIGQASQALSEYKVTQEDMDFIKTSFNRAIEHGAKEAQLQRDHQEVAVVLIKGNWGVFPQGHVLIGTQNTAIQVFVFHETLVNERHKVLAKKLVENKAIILLPGCDSDYLYQVLSTVCEEHFMETAKRLAMGLPIYEVTFDKEGEFEIVDLGKV